MLTDEIALALAQFFDQTGPSHDELTLLFKRAGFSEYDPLTPTSGAVGKMKRVRGLLTSIPAGRRGEGHKLCVALIDALRSHGAFVTSSIDFAGEAKISALRSALRRQGYELDREGRVLPMNLDALDGVDLDEALESYVQRGLLAHDDPELMVGNSKDLVEAVARRVLVLNTGSYPQGDNFDATLYQAFDRLGLATPEPRVLEALDRDAIRAFEQAVWLLGITGKRVRNQYGTGHGRPAKSDKVRVVARSASQAGALVARVLLDRSSVRD